MRGKLKEIPYAENRENETLAEIYVGDPTYESFVRRAAENPNTQNDDCERLRDKKPRNSFALCAISLGFRALGRVEWASNGRQTVGLNLTCLKNPAQMEFLRS